MLQGSQACRKSRSPPLPRCCSSLLVDRACPACSQLWSLVRCSHCKSPRQALGSPALSLSGASSNDHFLLAFRIVALKRRDKGAHSESPYGLDAEGKDRGEGFPFWATTWERALKAAAGDEAVVDALYAMAAWVFQEAAAELTEVSTAFGPSLVSCPLPSSPAHC
jgi:hypothetical protein